MKPLGQITLAVVGALLVAAVIEAACWLSQHHVARTLVVGAIGAVIASVLMFRVGRSDA